MPLVSVVFPLPSSPVSRTRMGGFRRLANSLPHSLVSSAECVIISSATPLQLLQQVAARAGDSGGDFRRQKAGLVGISHGYFGGFAVQVDAERENTSPIVGLELRSQRSEQSGQDVAGATFCQAGITRSVDEGCSVGGGDDGVRSFEHYVGVPSAGGLLRDLDAIFLHRLCRTRYEARHFSRMGRDGEEFRLALAKGVGISGKSVQAVGIEDKRQLALLNDSANEVLGFGLKSEAGTYGENRFVFLHSRKTALGEILHGGCTVRRGRQRLGHELRMGGRDDRKHDVGRCGGYE